MVKAIVKLVFLGIIAGGWALSAAALHVVRTPGDAKSVVVVTKNQLSFKDTYVDVRNWSLADAGSHPEVVQRLVALDKQDALSFLVDTNNGDVKSQLLDAAAKGPPAPEPAKSEPAKSDHKPGAQKPVTSSARM